VRYPQPARLFRIADPWFGGWTAANARWFDPEDGLMTAIGEEIGGERG